jgi:hypothetical protein
MFATYQLNIFDNAQISLLLSCSDEQTVSLLNQLGVFCGDCGVCQTNSVNNKGKAEETMCACECVSIGERGRGIPGVAVLDMDKPLLQVLLVVFEPRTFY